jgi:hypothetical protein
MIDVLAVTHAGRLAVVERKADEDIHLPLQGLDYWSRLEWHTGILLRCPRLRSNGNSWSLTSVGAMA